MYCTQALFVLDLLAYKTMFFNNYYSCHIILRIQRRFILPYFLGVPHCDGVRVREGRRGKVSADVGFLTDSEGYRHMDTLRRKENGRVVIYA